MQSYSTHVIVTFHCLIVNAVNLNHIYMVIGDNSVFFEFKKHLIDQNNKRSYKKILYS